MIGDAFNHQQVVQKGNMVIEGWSLWQFQISFLAMLLINDLYGVAADLVTIKSEEISEFTFVKVSDHVIMLIINGGLAER